MFSQVANFLSTPIYGVPNIVQIDQRSLKLQHGTKNVDIFI